MTSRKALRRKPIELHMKSVIDFLGIGGLCFEVWPKGKPGMALEICVEASNMILGRPLAKGERFTCTLGPPKPVKK